MRPPTTPRGTRVRAASSRSFAARSRAARPVLTPPPKITLKRPNTRPTPCPAPTRQHRNAEVDARGEERSHATHVSATDPDARLYKTSPGTGAMLCFIGHALMENRSGLIVQGDLTRADGHAERRAALDMIHSQFPGSTRRLTLGADKSFDTAEYVADLRQACVTPHVAQKSRYSAIDARTTRQDGYAVSIKHRKRIDLRRDNDPPDRCLILLIFGRARTIGGMTQTLYRGVERVRSRFILTMAANNLARLPRLLAP